MAATAEVMDIGGSDVPEGVQLGANECFIAGRIKSSEVYQNRHTTRITTPAVDTHSFPGFVEVRSPQALGRDGQDVRIVARIGGMPNRFTSKQTGAEVEVARMWLDHVRNV